MSLLELLLLGPAAGGSVAMAVLPSKKRFAAASTEK